MPTVPIRRIAAVNDSNFYRAVVAPGEPVIIEGAAKSWKAHQQWSFDWFADNFGDAEVSVGWYAYSRDDSGLSATRRGHEQQMSLREYIASTRRPNHDPGYLIATDMFYWHPSLLDYVAFPELGVIERMKWRVFFMGAPGAYTQLHFDRADNLCAMIRGHKRWQLFAPDKTNQLAALEPSYIWAVFSSYDFDNRKMRSNEELGLIEPDRDFVLSEGDMLYLPHGWWHRVQSQDETISTNIWWWSYGLAARLAPSLALASARQVMRRVQRRFGRFRSPSKPVEAAARPESEQRTAFAANERRDGKAPHDETDVVSQVR